MDCSLVTVRHVVGGYAARLRASAALARVVSLAVVNLRGRIDLDFCSRQLSKNLQKVTRSHPRFLILVLSKSESVYYSLICSAIFITVIISEYSLFFSDFD